MLLAHLKAEVADERSEFIRARKSPQKSPLTRPHDEPGFPIGTLRFFFMVCGEAGLGEGKM